MRRNVPRAAFAFALLLPLLLVPAVAPPVAAFIAATSSGLSVLLLALPALVPSFTRLLPNRLLEDGVRPRIMSLLGTEPGLGIIDVKQRLQIGWGTAVHHLERLERAGLVVSEAHGRRRRFYLPDDSRARRTAASVLGVDTNRRILDFLRENPHATQTEVRHGLALSAPLAHKYLSRLAETGLLSATRDGKNVRYEAAASVEDAIQERSRITANGPQGPAGNTGTATPMPFRAANAPVNTDVAEGVFARGPEADADGPRGR